MTQLWLIRHGQTDWNLEGRYQGQADPPLNATGQAQAEALAAHLDGRRFEAIYSSDLQRARATAEAIADRHGLPLKLDARLREIHQGEWDGLRVTEIMARYPREWAARESNPAEARPPGGESPREVAGRVWAAADDIARTHPGGRVLVVSHGFSLATLLCRARGLPLGRAFDLILDNARPEVIEWIPQESPEASI
jgi:alpha-ribazole phosphatase